jgi:hypothetical protein
MLLSAFEPRSRLIITDWSGSGVHRKVWTRRGLLDVPLHTAAAIATVYPHWDHCIGVIRFLRPAGMYYCVTESHNRGDICTK